MLAQQGVGNQLQLLIVILPDVSGSYDMHTYLSVWVIHNFTIYYEFCYINDSRTFAGKIKRVCETDIGVVSQCCLPKHASRPNKQYLENVALKINVKVRKPIFFAISFFCCCLFLQECINSFHLSRLVGATRFLSEPLYAMAYPLCQKSQQSSLVQMSHPPPAGEDSASSIAAVSFFL